MHDTSADSFQPLSISVIVATYGRGQLLITTLQSLLRCEYPLFDITVVDQTTKHDEATQSQLDAIITLSGLRYIRLPIPNLPLARNVGVEATQGEILVFCDDDVTVTKDFLSHHASPYRDATISAVAGRILGADRILDDGSNVIGKRCKNGTATSNFHLPGPRCEVDWGIGCNMSFRRSALVNAGGFDERYIGPGSCEDGDVFARLKSRGGKAIFAPHAVLTHFVALEGGGRAGGHSKRMYAMWHNLSMYWLLWNNFASFPGYLLSTLRWMKADIRSQQRPLWALLGYLPAFPHAMWSVVFVRRDRLRRKLKTGGVIDSNSPAR